MLINYLTPKNSSVKLIRMPKRSTSKIPRFSFLFLKKIKLNQILYTLLLISTFLLGYLFARVQFLESGQNTETAPTAQGQQPSGPAEKVNVKPGHLPALGKKDAKVTIIEFADFRCPFCARFFTDTEPQIIKEYVDTGKAKFIFRHFAFLGSASTVAANAAECANEQEKFWEYYNYLYKNQPPESDTTMFNTETLTEAAGNLGLDTEQFRSCLDSSKHNEKVEKDASDGRAAGVSGTPTFFINGRSIVGAVPYDNFKQIIEEELKKN